MFFKFKEDFIMSFFTTAVSTMSTLVVALGGGVGVWGVVNLMEGYGADTLLPKARVSSSLWRAAALCFSV